MTAPARPLLDRELATAADPVWLADRRARLDRQMARVDRELADRGETVCTTRGKPQAVLCLDVFGWDGRPLRFPTTSAAGLFVAHVAPDGLTATADHVRRAIVRGGRCGGRRFAWANGRAVTDADRERERGG